MTLRREDFRERRNPHRVRIVDVPPALLLRRQPVRGAPASAAEVFETVGAESAPAFFERRRLRLAVALRYRTINVR